MSQLSGRVFRKCSKYKGLRQKGIPCRGRVHEDFARILHFKESVFTCLYRLIDQDTYPAIRAFFEEKTEKITDSNIMEIRDLTEKYSDLSDDGNDPSGICTFLEELKGILEKQG